MLIAQAGGRRKLVAPTVPPDSLGDLELAFKFMWDFGTGLGIKPPELIFFFNKLLILLCSCDERRYEQWDCISWWDYTEAATKSPAFQKFLATGLTRTLVAAQAKQISARTGGLILCQLLLDMVTAGQHVDRVLDGPTSEVWIDPWIAHLRKLGVKFRDDAAVSGIHCEGQHITSVTVHGPTGPDTVTAKHYVMAMPVERLRGLVSNELRAAEPRLDALPRLVTRWMNGAMFYLRKMCRWCPVTSSSSTRHGPLPPSRRNSSGPTSILRSAATERCAEFCRSTSRIGLSLDRLPSKVATACNLQEIHDEVWYQITDAIKDKLIAADQRCQLVPRSRHPVPEPNQRDEPRAVADQHRRLVGRPARRGDSDTQPLPGRRFRPHLHRSGDDGRSQRGGAARGQRNSRRDRKPGKTLSGMEVAGAWVACAVARVGPTSMATASAHAIACPRYAVGAAGAGRPDRAGHRSERPLRGRPLVVAVGAGPVSLTGRRR